MNFIFFYLRICRAEAMMCSEMRILLARCFLAYFLECVWGWEVRDIGRCWEWYGRDYGVLVIGWTIMKGVIIG